MQAAWVLFGTISLLVDDRSCWSLAANMFQTVWRRTFISAKIHDDVQSFVSQLREAIQAAQDANYAQDMRAFFQECLADTVSEDAERCFNMNSVLTTGYSTILCSATVVALCDGSCSAAGGHCLQDQLGWASKVSQRFREDPTFEAQCAFAVSACHGAPACEAAPALLHALIAAPPRRAVRRLRSQQPLPDSECAFANDSGTRFALAGSSVRVLSEVCGCELRLSTADLPAGLGVKLQAKPQQALGASSVSTAADVCSEVVFGVMRSVLQQQSVLEAALQAYCLGGKAVETCPGLWLIQRAACTSLQPRSTLPYVVWNEEDVEATIPGQGVLEDESDVSDADSDDDDDDVDDLRFFAFIEFKRCPAGQQGAKAPAVWRRAV